MPRIGREDRRRRRGLVAVVESPVVLVAVTVVVVVVIASHTSIATLHTRVSEPKAVVACLVVLRLLHLLLLAKVAGIEHFLALSSPIAYPHSHAATLSAAAATAAAEATACCHPNSSRRFRRRCHPRCCYRCHLKPFNSNRPFSQS
jgi:hypothetical protein